MVISKVFKEQTDQMIEAIKNKVKAVENGNILVAKPSLEEKTAGGLYVSSGHKELQEKLAGFGRIVGMARNILAYDDGKITGDVDCEVGDYVLFVHEATYKPPRIILQKIFGIEYPENFLWATTDKEIIAVFKPEIAA